MADVKETCSEKFKNICLGLAAILIPLVGIWFTCQQGKDTILQRNSEIAINKLQKDKEISQRYIELGIQILSSKPAVGSDSLRAWAVKIVNKYSDSDLKLSYQTQQLLITKISIPGVKTDSTLKTGKFDKTFDRTFK